MLGCDHLHSLGISRRSANRNAAASGDSRSRCHVDQEHGCDRPSVGDGCRGRGLSRRRQRRRCRNRGGVTLGVVDNHNSGIGGGCFILIRRANGKVFAIDGRETAPARATRDMFVRDGRPDTVEPTGPLASGVPGALAAYDLALRNWHPKTGRATGTSREIRGRRIPNRRRLRGGAQISRRVLIAIRECASNPAKPDGEPYAAGETLKQADCRTDLP